MVWACYAPRDSLSKTILQGTLEGERPRGLQTKYWTDNVKEWTYLLKPELLKIALRRKDWKRISAESFGIFLMGEKKERKIGSLSQRNYSCG